MVNIAVFVSGGGTNLQALIDAQASGIIKSGKISLVISSRKDAYALVRAETAGIKTAVVERKRCASQAQFEGQISEHLIQAKTDLIVLAGFMSILSREFTGKWDKRIINVHPSLIPSFCGEGYYGLRVHKAALDYGVKVTGATVHFVNEIPDGGEIIAQKAVYIKDGDTPEALQIRVMQEAEWIILPQATEKICFQLLNK